MKVESVFSHPKGRLVYMTDRDTTYLYVDTTEYLIDTTTGFVYTVFPVSSDSISLYDTYSFDAQMGDYWVFGPPDSNWNSWVGVGLGGGSAIVFGHPTIIKSFDFFIYFYGDTSGGQDHNPAHWFPYLTRDYAYGFGMVQEGLEGGGGRVLIGAILKGDSMGTILGVEEEQNDIPKQFSLSQNYPNPFNPTTIISYQLSVFSHVTLKVYDILGREVRTLVNERETAGQHVIQWDGTDQNGRHVASGVYYYRLTTPSGSITKKAVLAK